MGTPSTVVTLEDIVGATSAMRLTLKNKSESLANQNLSGSKESNPEDECTKLARELVESLVEKTKAELKEAQTNIQDLNDLKDKKAREEALKKNKEKFDAITEKSVQNLRRIGEMVKEEMDKLPPDDQAQVLTFWECAQDFFGGVLDWLSSMFKYMVEKIRKGYRIVKNAIKGVFNTVCRILGDMFKRKDQREKEQREKEQRERGLVSRMKKRFEGFEQGGK